MAERIKKWAKRLKADIAVLYLAYRHKDTPWYARLAAIITVGYALSPIDLIPDFVPVLGFVDDAILLPLFIWISLKLIPQEVITLCRESAEEVFSKGKPKNYLAGGIIVLL
ncbi:MAG TPA: YkvA family protein, partial [Clostridia bacterium]|nr:YkvA family protein [Clostridia bacterium]